MGQWREIRILQGLIVAPDESAFLGKVVEPNPDGQYLLPSRRAVAYQLLHCRLLRHARHARQVRPSKPLLAGLLSLGPRQWLLHACLGLLGR
jgi:hypothetical protein